MYWPSDLRMWMMQIHSSFSSEIFRRDLSISQQYFEKKAFFLSDSICEICEREPAVIDDVIRLCSECSCRYMVLLEWAKQHPQISGESLESLKVALRVQMSRRKETALPRSIIESFESYP